VHTVRD